MLKLNSHKINMKLLLTFLFLQEALLKKDNFHFVMNLKWFLELLNRFLC